MVVEVHVDADELLYGAAFALEKVAYKIKTSKNEYDLGTKYTRTQIKNDLELSGKVENLDYEIITYKHLVGPESFARQILKAMINRLRPLGHVNRFLHYIRLHVYPAVLYYFRE